MQVPRPPQVSPYLREKTHRISESDNKNDDVEDAPQQSRSFESFLTPERRESTANDRTLLAGSMLYQLASQTSFYDQAGHQEPAQRYYRKLHDKALALARAGVDAHHFDV